MITIQTSTTQTVFPLNRHHLRAASREGGGTGFLHEGHEGHEDPNTQRHERSRRTEKSSFRDARLRSVCVVSVFALTLVLVPASGLAQASAVGRAAVGSIVDRWVTRTEQLVIPAAEALPEEAYAFAPTAGEFAGVRTFAEQVSHLAAANYQLAARALGERPPAGTANETAPPTVKTKAQILEYLRGSFAALHRAAGRITVQNVEDPIRIGHEIESATGLVIDAIAHAQNHYGQMVEYLRMNHIVPPASR
jgi:DinB superfamily